MKQQFSYYYPTEWVAERTPFYFQTALLDERGAIISSATLATCVLTLYDAMVKPYALLPGTWPQDIKNVVGGRATISAQGLLDLTLAHATATLDDTAILDPTHTYEQRVALVEFSRTTSGKSGAFEIVFVIRNVLFRQ